MKLTVKVGRNHVRIGDHFSVSFQRTLRIPDDGSTYPLPPGLGCFPLRRVDDYADRIPDGWADHGGVFLPMYQREAMWLSFSASMPHALEVAVGKVCALTGKRWREGLAKKRQNYLVVPAQPWLDGICVGGGRIRQFVAMPLGMGYTVEGQVTGEERFGGIQLALFASRPGRFPEPRCLADRDAWFVADCCSPTYAASGPMGLGAGGRMKQKIYPDPYGIDTWDPESAARLFVHIVNSELWSEITGEAPPPTPVTAKEYAAHGLPWFDLYDEQAPTLDGTGALQAVKSVKDVDAGRSNLPLQDDDSVAVGPVKKLGNELPVKDGIW